MSKLVGIEGGYKRKMLQVNSGVTIRVRIRVRIRMRIRVRAGVGI